MLSVSKMLAYGTIGIGGIEMLIVRLRSDENISDDFGIFVLDPGRQILSCGIGMYLSAESKFYLPAYIGFTTFAMCKFGSSLYYYS